MQPTLLVFTFVGCLFQGGQSAWWTSTLQDDHELFFCVGASAALPWHYEKSPEENVLNIQWLHEDESEELVAMKSADSFIALPAYAEGRVQSVNNAGIVLRQTTVSDSGNYTVEVHVVDDSGNHEVLRQTVVVHISDDLILQDGQVQVQQTPEAVLNPDTDQWSIQLTCGVFHFNGSPLFSVEWIDPDGIIHHENDFDDGKFRLLLTHRIKGGNYTCRIPSDHLNDACIHSSTTAKGEATLFVDKLDARLTLLEKENEQLKYVSNEKYSQLQELEHKYSLLKNNTDARLALLEFENEKLKQEKNSTDAMLSLVHAHTQQLQTATQHLHTETRLLQTDTQQLQADTQQLQTDTQQLLADTQQLQTDTQQLQTDVGRLETDTRHLQNDTQQLQIDTQQLQTNTQQLQTDTQHLRTDTQNLRTENQQLRQRLDTTGGATSPHVSFHATGLLDSNPASGSPLIFCHVTINQGGAYSGTTGYFTAPYPGTYFFVATSGTGAANDSIHFDLYVDSTQVGRAKAYDHEGHSAFSTLHGVVHLRAGQRVWVRSYGENDHDPLSSFSGFLISRDL